MQSKTNYARSIFEALQKRDIASAKKAIATDVPLDIKIAKAKRAFFNIK